MPMQWRRNQTALRAKTNKMPRTRSLAGRFWAKVDTSERNEKGCWLWTASTRNGYGAFRISSDAGMAAAHRVAWLLYYGELPHGLLVCHHCDNPRCVRREHLFLGDHLANCHDAIEKGRMNVHRLRPPEVRIDNRQLPLRLVG